MYISLDSQVRLNRVADLRYLVNGGQQSGFEEAAIAGAVGKQQFCRAVVVSLTEPDCERNIELQLLSRQDGLGKEVLESALEQILWLKVPDHGTGGNVRSKLNEPEFEQRDAL